MCIVSDRVQCHYYMLTVSTLSPHILNPLSPGSDQHEISPGNINAFLNRVVMRTDMITQDEFA